MPSRLPQLAKRSKFVFKGWKSILRTLSTPSLAGPAEKNRETKIFLSTMEISTSNPSSLHYSFPPRLLFPYFHYTIPHNYVHWVQTSDSHLFSADLPGTFNFSDSFLLLGFSCSLNFLIFFFSFFWLVNLMCRCS